MNRAHTGEDKADLFYITLEELGIEHKILTMMIGNATNNESLVSELFLSLKEKFHRSELAVRETDNFRFLGVDSYIRYLAHILNLTISNILSILKSDDYKTAARYTILCREI